MASDLVLSAREAKLNITWGGHQGELGETVSFDASNAEVLRWATEAVRGGIPGIPADPNVDFTDFSVRRFDAVDEFPNRINVVPKTPFG